MVPEEVKSQLTEHYRKLFREHGPTPMATQMSRDGQVMRFEKLAEIADLSNCSVLDLGCGIGDGYPIYRERYPTLRYTGIDLVSDMTEYAAQTYPDARWICRDVLRDGLEEKFDYVLISALFNNEMPDRTPFLFEIIDFAFAHCQAGLAFNFISNRTNFKSEGIVDHDPVAVFQHCIDTLSRKVNVFHHYGRADVAVFVYR